MVPGAQWHHDAQVHREWAQARTFAHKERRARHEKHPVYDFLFTYYPFSAGKLTRWQPGAGAAVELLTDADAAEFDRRWFTFAGAGDHRTAWVDTAAWRAERGSGAQFIANLLDSTLHREASFGCFGMHEWAMVYRLGPNDRRHEDVPLRLSQEDTDAVVESHRVQCSHFDAFRFFTPPARPRNTLTPTREGMVAMEQPGCLHAGMDLYKWAMKCEPVVSSVRVREAFDLAIDIRTLDMQASPYDLSGWGFDPVMVETAAGKAEYKERQEALSLRAQALRAALLSDLAVAGITV